jgi:uncharacterized protein (DUF983 family)
MREVGSSASHHPRKAETALRQPDLLDVARSVGRVVLLRCPHCGGGPVLTALGSVRENCRGCGLRFERTDYSYFSGAMFFGILISEGLVVLTLVITMFITWPNVPWDAIQWGAAAGLILVAPALIPFSRVVWLAIDVLLRPVVPEELKPRHTV